MDHDDEVLQRVELMLAQAKRMSRESRILVQQAAQLRSTLQPERQKETNEQDKS